MCAAFVHGPTDHLSLCPTVSLTATIGDGVVVFPVSLAMHYYGDDDQPNFIPAFVAYYILSMVGVVFIWRLRGKVRVPSNYTHARHSSRATG